VTAGVPTPSGSRPTIGAIRQRSGRSHEGVLTGVSDELQTLAATIRATDLVKIAVDSFADGSATRRSMLELIAEAGPLAERALRGRWSWLDQRRAS
jgi:hypothetical protein